MDSSDSDDEATRKIKEAVSEELIGCMMSNDKDNSASCNKSKVHEKIVKNTERKSVRKQLYNDNWNEYNGLKITPEFKEHVAKKLANYLDSIIQIKTYKPPSQKDQSMIPKEITGIKLLSTSTQLVTLNPTEEDTKAVKRNYAQVDSSDSDSDTEMKKFSSVVVSGSDILNGGEGVFQIKEEPKPVVTSQTEVGEESLKASIPAEKINKNKLKKKKSKKKRPKEKSM